MLMPMAKTRMPQMTEAAYIKVRDAFRRTLPARVTSTWVKANIDGYHAEASARSLISNLGLMSLIDKEGAPTDIAQQWRVDEGYAAACDVILRSAFPSDLVDAVSGSVPDTEVLVNLFMNYGVGVGSAKNLARIFRLVASKSLPSGESKDRSKREQGPRRPEATNREASGAAHHLPPESDTRPQSAAESGPGLTVLRYFLERGRLAELRVPADMDAKERKKLFAHLKIDLLDEVAE